MDHPGVMARCVWDLAVLLEVMAWGDEQDEATWQTGASSRFDYMFDVLPEGVALGRARGIFHDLAEPQMRAMMSEVEDLLKRYGANVETVALPAEFSEVLTRHRTVMAVEAAAFHERRLKRHPEDYGPNITQLLNEGLACPAPEYARCKEHQQFLRADAEHWFDWADALLVPATRGPAPDKATTGDPAFNSPWSYTGQPTVSLPVGRTSDGMPLAIQLIGKPNEDRDLLDAAAWCEKVLAQPLQEPPV